MSGLYDLKFFSEGLLFMEKQRENSFQKILLLSFGNENALFFIDNLYIHE